uniref:Iron-sulfur cluster assembly enzyme ISCU n=1 Tax=Gasterosteus aculeatus aculeatus TaxID=481459 RepID=G3P202_GASAC
MAMASLGSAASSLVLFSRRVLRPELTALCSYHTKVVDHYENPRNVGTLDKNAKNVGTGLVGAPACGDVMKLQIQVDENGKIVDAKFKTFGCGSAIASSSLATEWVKGKSVDEALKIRNTDIAKELCLPPVKLHCSMLAEDAIKAALSDYRVKQDMEKKLLASSTDLRRGSASKALSGTERRQLLLILRTCRLTRADSEGGSRTEMQFAERSKWVQAGEIPQLSQGAGGDVSDAVFLQQQGLQPRGQAAREAGPAGCD